MTKTFNFTSKNNNTFQYNTTDYSKSLDNIIAASIINKNSYLFDNDKEYNANLFSSLIGKKKPIIIDSNLKDDYKFIKAVNFLAHYKKYKKTYNIPYIFGKMYKLTDGTPIVFYNDEIQIGFDTYSYDDFDNIDFINSLKPKTKNIIINIFTTGLGNIKINIL